MPALFTSPVIADIQACATRADKLCRDKLNNGKIVDENDYTSNFTCLFDFAINTLVKTSGLTSSIQKLSPSRERALGADGCIILQNIIDNTMKIGIFEAKWPRLTRMNYDWDYIQKNGVSHFHNQLCRQEGKVDDYVFWEMFYLEHAFNQQPTFMPGEGSACAWHSSVHNVSHTSHKRPKDKPWQSSHLSQWLDQDFYDISYILGEICECHQGEIKTIAPTEAIFQTGICPNEALVIQYGNR